MIIRRPAAVFVTLACGLALGIAAAVALAAAPQKFPKATIDHSSETVFGVTDVNIPKNGGGKLQCAVDIHTHKVALIGIPFIAVCE